MISSTCTPVHHAQSPCAQDRSRPHSPVRLGPSRDSALPELIEKIRRLQRVRRGPLRRCPTGLPALDAALGGGLALGCVHELLAASPETAARSIALRLAAQSAGPQQWLLYLDTTDDFYPPAAVQLGVPLDRLLVVRTRRSLDTLWVCEQALRCPAVAALIAPLRNIDSYVSRRLQLAAEAGGGLGLLLLPDGNPGPTFAASRLRFEPVPPDSPDRTFQPLTCDRGPNPPACGPDAKRPSHVRGCDVRRVRVSVLKLRESSPPEPFILELPFSAQRPPPLPSWDADAPDDPAGDRPGLSRPHEAPSAALRARPRTPRLGQSA